MSGLTRKALPSSHPLLRSWSRRVKQRPLLFFAFPFIGTIVGASFALSRLTQTRYDYNAQRVQSVSHEEKLNLERNRKKVDLREEYFRLTSGWDPSKGQAPAASAAAAASSPSRDSSAPYRKDVVDATNTEPTPLQQDRDGTTGSARRRKHANAWDWDGEQVRVPRPPGMSEWGSVGPEDQSPEIGVRLV